MFKFLQELFKKKPKEGDFILTKEYVKDGVTKGDLVLRIEHIVKNNYLCAKGRFEIQIIEGKKKLVWNFQPGQKLANISKNKVERVLSENQAYKLLEERIERVNKTKSSQ